MKPRQINPWPTKEQAPRLATLVEVLDRAGVSASTWARMAGTPQPVAIADRSLRWWSSEVDAYLAGLPRKPGKPAPVVPGPPRRTPRRPRKPALTAAE
jgi:predicted DNA-binding transcriptional regulator AlpA